MPDAAPITGEPKTLAANDLLQVGPTRKGKWRCPGCGGMITLTMCVACLCVRRFQQQKQKQLGPVNK